MTILEVIKNDHDRMRALCNRLLNNLESDEEKRSEIIHQIRAELIPHSRAEEAVLYNKMRTNGGPTEQVLDGFKEHAEAEALLYTLEAMDTMHVDYQAVAQKLNEALMHHMSEEETELFPEAKATFSKAQGEEMAKEFNEMKPRIREQNALISSAEFLTNLIPPEMTEMVKAKIAEYAPRLLH